LSRVCQIAARGTALQPMLIATAWHSAVRPANSASRTIITRIFPRHAALHNTPPLRWRGTPVQQFHATDLLSATHKSAPRRVRRDLGSGGGPFNFRRPGRRFDAIPANYILFGVLGINGVVFAAWTFVLMFQGTLQPPPSVRWLARWLQDNFINSYENLRQGRFWTLITSTFSHAQPGHALFNGLTFYFLAPTALAVLGNTQFLILYLGSGAFSSLLSLAWNKRNHHSHGASGAIYALASFFAFAAPRAQFLLFFVVPMPAWACIGAIACFDVYNAFTRRFPTLDSAGHVGGLTAGALYWIMRTRFRLP